VYGIQCWRKGGWLSPSLKENPEQAFKNEADSTESTSENVQPEELAILYYIMATLKNCFVYESG
jgi:hypothetical protein